LKNPKNLQSKPKYIGSLPATVGNVVWRKQTDLAINQQEKRLRLVCNFIQLNIMDDIMACRNTNRMPKKQEIAGIFVLSGLEL
jgi:hypothetical protein